MKKFTFRFRFSGFLFAFLFAFMFMFASAALAQTPAPAAAPAPAPRPAQTPKLLPPATIPPVPAMPTPPAMPALPVPPAPPKGEYQAINVNVTLTVAEEGGNAAAVKKSITIVTADGFSGSTRETATPSTGPTQFNADAAPTILANGKLRVSYSIQYSAGQNPIAPPEARARTDIRLNQVVILESGKPLKIWEGSDPVTDRRVIVEITATTLK